MVVDQAVAPFVAGPVAVEDVVEEQLDDAALGAAAAAVVVGLIVLGYVVADSDPTVLGYVVVVVVVVGAADSLLESAAVGLVVALVSVTDPLGGPFHCVLIFSYVCVSAGALLRFVTSVALPPHADLYLVSSFFSCQQSLLL